jgi:hypothetical protein
MDEPTLIERTRNRVRLRELLTWLIQKSAPETTAEEREAAFQLWIQKPLEEFRAGNAKIQQALEASGCKELEREADDLLDQIGALENRIWETKATSLSGLLGQIELLRQDGIDHLDMIVTGIKGLIAAER